MTQKSPARAAGMQTHRQAVSPHCRPEGRWRQKLFVCRTVAAIATTTLRKALAPLPSVAGDPADPAKVQAALCPLASGLPVPQASFSATSRLSLWEGNLAAAFSELAAQGDRTRPIRAKGEVTALRGARARPRGRWRFARLGSVIVAAGLLGACGQTPTPHARRSVTPSTTTQLRRNTTTARARSSATTPTTVSTTTPAAGLGYGKQGPRAAIPWNEVGPGWLLATWQSALGGPVERTNGPTAPTTAATSPRAEVLYLVDPLGGRYAITTLAHGDSLAAWSGDAKRVLLTSYAGANEVITEVDLVTGSVAGSFSLSASATLIPSPGFSSLGFTRPDGLAILLATRSGAGADSLTRLSPTGTAQLTYPSAFTRVGGFSGSFLSTPDGLQVVLGAAGGLAVVKNDGRVVAQLPVPGARGACSPVRWWSAGVILADCDGLWLIPTSGASPTVLANTQGAVQPENAWPVGSAVYVQATGACGSQFLAKLAPGGTVTQIAVPRVNNSDNIYAIGDHGNRLALQATLSCDGPGATSRPGPSLLWFDPAANAITVILGPPLNGGFVTDAILYGSRYLH